jgi:hypothetical protein
MLETKCQQCYLGRTSTKYPLPFIHSQIQTHGFNGLMPRHKAFLNAYKEMISIDTKYNKSKNPAVSPVTSVDIYPTTLFIKTGPSGVGKPNFTYCKTV